MALLHPGEPVLPHFPHRVELSQAVDAGEPVDQLHPRRRGAGPGLEHGHQTLPLGEGGMHGGQVGDQEQDDDGQHHGGSDEGQGHPTGSLGMGEAEGE